MTKNPLLVELFVEELPPKALKKLGDAFAGVLRDQLVAQGLADAGSVLTPYASPRRLAAHLTHVAERAADKAVSQKLMPVAVGLDASGQPTPALLKRLGALGADASAVPGLKRAMDGKAEALFYESTAKGATLAEGLQKALAEAIAKLPIPKVMSYQLESGCELPGWSSVSFVRPAHGLVALHGDTVVPIEALGLKAGRDTHGHRFEAAVDPVVLRNADSYALQLQEEGAVIAGFEARRAEIARQLAAAAVKVGGGSVPIHDDALLDEVTALVERPNVLVCSFEREFLEVPQECLILTMKANQKYFPLLDASSKLTNKFLVVSNISPADASAVIEGNERVVRPRLADAKFFFDQDRKKSLASRVESLGKVVYHNKLGTQGERVERVMRIARGIAQKLGDSALAAQATQAAQLAKADLVTDMVGEFPELQGTMGRYYALHDGLDVAVADAIEDHYKPRFAGDELPRNSVGLVVALADKLETLVGMFGIGNLPTGDRDPFALRRHALGVIRMLIEKDLPLGLDALLQDAAAQFKDIPGFESSKATVELQDFILDRLAGSLREQGASAQEVDAVLAPRPQRLGEVPKLLAAVRAFAALPAAAALAAANKRIGNILKKAPEADAHVSELLLQEPAEKALHAAMAQVVPAANAQFEAGDYTASLQTLAALREPVDAFFDGVMVNAEQADLRLNRLGLLMSLHAAMNRVAQLERLAV
ncbi:MULTISPECIES: glycine--tRNA ligase subunit beta [Variovorax]|uniref:glycine--tRNA ligase subunit beta n=1 Tax=Variovorax TaxID=34072 RepID=UPI00086E6F83|nr:MULTISPECIES: glycine--tRNA ligase subunit beta [Variovorax]MBN8752768.1 glycine--tRNA ligase subunit beta [Variovorax sp.]ODU16161.1 MAG: glycine--tRNA ligase subunit beta [Variovorax sp. SCN 67-85]ODV22568.1 MAG: glycine--tRNA ligase subunit beta [Variovorax sp. SCN 67-20]OJZ10353.1 MAG: glycine--tRNA ligase subunit beta [Variovorax sp. 67-131]UKI06992.1 glycine--tRNA ligase subunit beta [Variovorax paradoxus]